MRSEPDDWRRWILPLLVLCFAVNIGLFVWGLGRGLDIKDESYMLNSYRYPELYANFTSYFHFIVSRLFGPYHFGLLQYRIAGLLLKLFASTVFAWGFWRWSEASKASEDSEA